MLQELAFTGELFKVENTDKTKSSHLKVAAFKVEYCVYILSVQILVTSFMR